jgi:hypothetical protein
MDFNPEEYSIRHKETKVVPVFKFDAYHPAYVFNTYDAVAAIYRPVTAGITKGDYVGAPWVYYRNKSGQ